MNIFIALGGRDNFFELNYAKDQIRKLVGKNDNLVVNEYKRNDHQVYEDELQDMKQFISNIIN